MNKQNKRYEIRYQLNQRSKYEKSKPKLGLMVYTGLSLLISSLRFRAKFDRVHENKMSGFNWSSDTKIKPIIHISLEILRISLGSIEPSGGSTPVYENVGYNLKQGFSY